MKALVCATVLAAAAVVALDAAFPRPQGRVNDFAGVIDPATAAELTRLINETETRTSAQIAVVTVKSLDGMSVEEYAVRLFADWGIGKKGKDNGVLVLVAPVQRRIRIEVGYGLEPILPDAAVGRIIRQECLPPFRDNQYARGILQGVRRLAGIVQRRESAPMEAPQTRRRDVGLPFFIAVPFLGLFISIGAFAAGVAVRTRTRGALIFGAMFMGVPIFFVVATLLTPSALTLLAIGVAMGVYGYRKGSSAYWTKMMRGSNEPVDSASPWVAGPTGNGGGSSGGSSSGSSGGGSSGGSFGGGSSGGGGASGSW